MPHKVLTTSSSSSSSVTGLYQPVLSWVWSGVTWFISLLACPCLPPSVILYFWHFQTKIKRLTDWLGRQWGGVEWCGVVSVFKELIREPGWAVKKEKVRVKSILHITCRYLAQGSQSIPPPTPSHRTPWNSPFILHSLCSRYSLLNQRAVSRTEYFLWSTLLY